jgi:hypothetical protein
MATVSVNSWRSWLMEANDLSRRPEATPTPVILYWLAIEEYLAAISQSLNVAGTNHLTEPYRSAKLVLGSLNGQSDSILSRYKILVALLTGAPVDSGAEIWQEVDLLQKCRNCIVHPKSFVTKRSSLKQECGEAIEIHENHRRLISRLKAHKLLEVNFEQTITASWRDALSNEKVNLWAKQCSMSFITYVASFLPVSGTQITFNHEHLQPFFKESGIS